MKSEVPQGFENCLKDKTSARITLLTGAQYL